MKHAFLWLASLCACSGPVAVACISFFSFLVRENKAIFFGLAGGLAAPLSFTIGSGLLAIFLEDQGGDSEANLTKLYKALAAVGICVGMLIMALWNGTESKNFYIWQIISFLLLLMIGISILIRMKIQRI